MSEITLEELDKRLQPLYSVNTQLEHRLKTLEQNRLATPALNEITGAIAQFQANGIVLAKTKTVTVKMQSGGSYTFSYCPYDEVVKRIQPYLAEQGLAYTHSLVQLESASGMDNILVRTTLSHVSGQMITFDVPIQAARGKIQELGSAITYAKRYGLVGILGLAAEDDDDGNLSQGNEITSSTAKDTPKITQEQADELRQLIVGMEGDNAATFENQYIGYLRVGALEELEAPRFEAVKTALEKRASQHNGDDDDA